MFKLIVEFFLGELGLAGFTDADEVMHITGQSKGGLYTKIE